MVTIEEIRQQIEAAKEYLSLDPDSYWNMLPRIYYKDLPEAFQKQADKIKSHNLKEDIAFNYPIGTMEAFFNDEEKLERTLEEAFYRSKFQVESLDPIEISLYSRDFLSAWEDVLTDNLINLPNINKVTIQNKKIEKIEFPLDKPNRNLWGMLETDPTGQLTLAKWNVAKGKSNKEINVLFSIDFLNLQNVEITKQLNPYDKRVYLAVSALFNNGQNVISLSQIYNAMGYSGNSGDKDRKKINDSISKMNGAHIYIDNTEEADTYNYDRFKYDGSLLPMERLQAVKNGQTVEAAIHLFREPPMMKFARDRKQVTTVELKLLESPLNKTNANMELEDYLIEEISRIKKAERNNKMLYSTIYQYTHITTDKQKQRAPGKIKKLLDYYIQCKFIKAFKEEKDGFTITY